MFVGGSQAILRVQELIDKAARSGSTVLIIGESGVGKDVASNEIHARSKRSGRFLAVNCAAILGDLIESELFGHERGAFTSASARRLGIFEQANGGTVFLDEITEMKPELQPKLLRVLEDHKIRRVGGEESIQVNVRVIAATNRPLNEALESRKLREDLYYRLNVFKITIPPLRERLEDLDLLVATSLRNSIRSTERMLTASTPNLWPRSGRTIGRATCGSFGTRSSGPSSRESKVA